MTETRTQAGQAIAELLDAERYRGALVVVLTEGGATLAGPLADKVGARKVRTIDTSDVERAFYNRVRMNARSRSRHASGAMFGVVDAGSANTRSGSIVPHEPSINGVQGIPVILVDEGTTSDLMLRTVVEALRRGGPSRLAVASPAMAEGTADTLSSECDDLAVLTVTSTFEPKPAEKADRPHTARALMTQARTVTSDTSVKDLAGLLIKDDLDGVCVVDDGELVGVVTSMDLIFQERKVHAPTVFMLLDSPLIFGQKRAEAELDKIAGTVVSDIMTKEPKTITEDTPLEDIASMMVDGSYTLLPVLRDNQLVGVVYKQAVLETALKRWV